MFPPLCPFSSVLFRISFWFPDDFGLFYAFSVLYVHFLLPGSVFPSSFRMILDFFLLFLCFMSILIGSVPYFLLASGYFWTLFLFFSVLCPYERIRKSPTCVEFRNLQTTKSSESSGLRNAALRRIKGQRSHPFCSKNCFPDCHKQNRRNVGNILCRAAIGNQKVIDRMKRDGGP